MALVKGIRYDVVTGRAEEYEEEMELPDPKILELEQRIQELEAALRSEDWKTIKYVEGGMTETEWAAHIAARAAIRAEHNLAELKLTTPPYVQPTGAHDAYPLGAKVLWEDNVYESIIAANVWTPTAYPQGWKLI